MKLYVKLLTAALIMISSIAQAQQIISTDPTVSNTSTPVASGYQGPLPSITTVSPTTPQPPGSAVAYVPQGAPASVIKPYAVEFYPPKVQKSLVTRLSDGSRVEIDSDNSVHKVYDDGSRVAEMDGIHVLSDGTTIMIKDGKRVP